jgi:hypothetical protein
MSILTLYLVAFAMGVFLGDLVANKVFEIEKALGIISTGAVYTMGTSVIYERFIKQKYHLDFASLVATALILAQTAMVFNLFPLQIANIFYYFSSLFAMIFVWSFSTAKKELK